MEVTVYGPLRGATGAKTVEVTTDGQTVADVLAALVSDHPQAESHLYDDGSLRPSVRVAVDGESASPEDHCPPDAAVTVHPAVQGG